jgi:hypothetical protein
LGIISVFNFLGVSHEKLPPGESSRLDRSRKKDQLLGQGARRCGGRLHVAVFAHERRVDGSVK